MNANLTDYARTTADAYAGQYLSDHRVMGQPTIVYNRTTCQFGWQSSLTPVGDDEVVVDTLEEGVFGETGDDPDVARAAITNLLLEQADWDGILSKIEGEEEGY